MAIRMPNAFPRGGAEPETTSQGPENVTLSILKANRTSSAVWLLVATGRHPTMPEIRK
jgi:hypothetical protein